MFNFLKSLFKTKYDSRIFTGVLGDADQAESIPFKEVVSESAGVNFPIKKLDETKIYPYQFQYSSSACVAFTVAKIATVLYCLKTNRMIRFSPAFYYSRRTNKPEEGMFLDDAIKLARDGAVINDLLPAEGLTENAINNLIVEDYHLKSADAFSFPDNWVNLPVDFDTVASTLNKTGKGIMMWFTFGNGEFFGTDYPKIINSRNPYRHSVTAIDFLNLNGVDYLLIEDSADEYKHYRKLISREFFKSKCILARYPINLKYLNVNDNTGTTPVFNGTVESLQDCLRYFGTFPKNIESTGFFGKITKQALSLYQKKVGIPETGILDSTTVSSLKDQFK